jgi:hypothetical protein
VDQPGTKSNADDTIKEMLMHSRFLLTSRSSAPELTLFGTPRMSLWPIHGDLVEEYRSGNPKLTASSPYSRYDMLIGFNAAIQKDGRLSYPYFFQREDPGSRHAEFYDRFDRRNTVLQRYIEALVKKPFPGFQLATLADGTNNSTSFNAKYSYSSGASGSKGTDLSCIVALMLDYMRNQNLADPNLQKNVQYTQYDDPEKVGQGQVTPICLCGGSNDHSKVWYNSQNTLPKGIGRLPTVSEVAMVISVQSSVSASAVAGAPGATQRQQAAGNLDSATEEFLRPASGSQGGTLVNVSLLVELFAPAQGWSELRPRMRVLLIGGTEDNPIPVTRPTSGAGVAVGPTDIPVGGWTVGNQPLLFRAGGSFGKSAMNSVTHTLSYNAATSDTSDGLPARFIGWGGNIGTRWSTRAIHFRPIFIPGSAGPGGAVPSVDVGFDPGIKGAQDPHPRLMVFDGSGSAQTVGGPGDFRGTVTGEIGNLIQCIPLAFPALPSIQLPGSGKELAPDYVMNAARNGETPFPKTAPFKVMSLVPAHGDYRLVAAKRNVIVGKDGSGATYPIFVPVAGYFSEQHAHALRDPDITIDTQLRQNRAVSQDARRFMTPYASLDRLGEGGQRLAKIPENTDAGYALPDYPMNPNDPLDGEYKTFFDFDVDSLGTLQGGRMSPVIQQASTMIEGNRRDPNRRRGDCDPAITGDFDTGVGHSPDGAFINRGDDGIANSVIGGGGGSGSSPYYNKLISDPAKSMERPTALFSPNRQVPSAGVFGSLPTGVDSNVPWQTLLFRPDPNRGTPSKMHYGAKTPKDHLLMDLFWMPVVEPYAISEPLQTAGKINMNYQIMPFTYIKRATALHALFKAERITAIPNDDRDYKKPQPDSVTSPADRESYRYNIDSAETLEQFDRRFSGQSKRPEDTNRPTFLSATEICDQWLVPAGLGRNSSDNNMVEFWRDHLRTGDNLKERPYAALYPRLTTRSNTYRVHVRAQAIKQLRGKDPTSLQPEAMEVLSEYRGSYLIERSIDPTRVSADNRFKDFADILSQSPTADLADVTLERYYSYRVGQVKQFAK